MKTSIPLILFFALCGLLYFGLGHDPKVIPSVLLNKPAPEFSIPTLYDENRLFQKKDFYGKVTLLNIWATWCPACRAEHDLLLGLKQSGVNIYGLDYKDDKQSAKDLLEKLGNPYQIVGYDEKGLLAIDWGFYGAPETFVIDKKGVIRDKIIGPLSLEIIADRLQPLLAKLEVE